MVLSCIGNNRGSKAGKHIAMFEITSSLLLYQGCGIKYHESSTEDAQTVLVRVQLWEKNNARGITNIRWYIHVTKKADKNDHKTLARFCDLVKNAAKVVPSQTRHTLICIEDEYQVKQSFDPHLLENEITTGILAAKIATSRHGIGVGKENYIHTFHQLRCRYFLPNWI